MHSSVIILIVSLMFWLVFGVGFARVATNGVYHD
jgi:hypothetical protein